jgi:adenylosuccinate synthase
LARKTAKINGATQAALTKLDCIYPIAEAKEVLKTCRLRLKRLLRKVETRTGVPVTFNGTGPDALDIIDRRKQ